MCGRGGAGNLGTYLEGEETVFHDSKWKSFKVTIIIVMLFLWTFITTGNTEG